MSGLWDAPAEVAAREAAMLKLEAAARGLAASGASPRRCWRWPSPCVIGVLLFVALGKDPVRGLQVFFWEPIKTRLRAAAS